MAIGFLNLIFLKVSNSYKFLHIHKRWPNTTTTWYVILCLSQGAGGCTYQFWHLHLRFRLSKDLIRVFARAKNPPRNSLFFLVCRADFGNCFLKHNYSNVFESRRDQYNRSRARDAKLFMHTSALRFLSTRPSKTRALHFSSSWPIPPLHTFKMLYSTSCASVSQKRMKWYIQGR